MEKKKMLGVLGGMGPMATAYFMELVIRMTDAETDQEHLDMLVYNLTSIPDRTGFILGKTKESPLPALIRAGQALAEQGAEQIAIPVRKGADTATLLKAVNDALADLSASGELTALSEKYFGMDISKMD